MANKFRPWPFLVVFYSAAIAGLTMLLVFIYSALTGFQPLEYFRMLSNILFFEGALVLTFGAFVEFFVKARSPSLGRSMLIPYEVLSKLFALEAKDRDAARMDEESSGGWMLIAVGAVIIIASAAFAFASMK